MKTRRNPWDFGLRLEDILEEEDRRMFSKKIIDTANDLYDLTLRCPPPRHLTWDEKSLIKKATLLRDGIDEERALCLGLVVGRGKPAGEHENYNEGPLSELSINYHKRKIRKHKFEYNFGYCSKIVQILNGLDSSPGGDLRYPSKGLLYGMAYGFPLGDIVGYCRIRQMPETTSYYFKKWKKSNRYRKGLGYLVHIPTPLFWPSVWKKDVGIDGEEYLNRFYKKILK